VENSVIVTGASGFVGRKLVTKFRDAGYRTTALDITNPKIDGIEFIECDIGQEIEIDQNKIPTGAVFVHLAALSTDNLCKAAPKKALEVNLVGTTRVAELATQTSASQLIFASSEWVYPENTEVLLQTESDMLSLESLNSLYAMTKLMGENLLRATCLVPTTILRFGIVYGPRSTPGSAPESIAHRVSLGEDVSIGSGATSRRFIYVDDLIDGIYAVAIDFNNVKNQIFNLAGDTLISLSQIAEVSMKLSKNQVQIIDGGAIPSIRNPDPSKFMESFQFSPSVSIEEGLSKCLKAMTTSKNV
jgi:UDP-glucose 4-epimerase